MKVTRRIGRLSPMILVLLAGLATAVNAQTTGSNPAPTPDPDVVKISTALVQMDMTVTDRKGRVVPDIKPDEVELFINGKRQTITHFSFVGSSPAATASMPKAKVDKEAAKLEPPPAKLKADSVRRSIALVVDDLMMSGISVYYAKKALKKFITEQMQDGDLVAIVRTRSGVGALQQFTNDKRLLFAAIDSIKWNPNASSMTAFAPIEKTPLEMAKEAGAEISAGSIAAEKERLASQRDFRQSTFVSGSLGALRYVVSGMSDLPGRKAVVLLSDGFSIYNIDELGGRYVSPMLQFLRTLIDEANRASVVFYTIDMRGLEPAMLTAEDNVTDHRQVLGHLSERQNLLIDTQEGPNILAKGTGGFALKNNNDFDRSLRNIINDQSYYLLAYEPDTDTFDPKSLKFNDIEIRVKRPDLQVRYRAGFFGRPDSKSANEGDIIDDPSPGRALHRAITSPFQAKGIDLRLNAIFGAEAKAVYVRSLIHVDARDLQFKDEPTGEKTTVFNVLAVSFGSTGVADQLAKTYTLTLPAAKYKDILEKGFVYFFTFPVKKPGAYQYRIAIRDAATGRVGSASQFIQVPDLGKKNVEISTPVLAAYGPNERERAVAGGDTPAVSDLMADTALRRFKRGSILQYGSQVYNVRPDSTVTAKVRVFRDGKLIFDGSERPLAAGPTPTLNGSLDLGGIEAGDYILQVIVAETRPGKTPKYATQFVEFEVVQ